MEKFEHFEELFDILFKTYIAQYQEFDQTGHCYYSMEHVVPIKNDKGIKPLIQLIDAKSGKLAHEIVEETDFDYFTVEEVKALIHVSIHLKSEYHYELYAKKL